MKILFSSGHFLPSKGGVEQFVSHLASGLAPHGFDIAIVSSNTHSAPTQEATEYGTVFRLPTLNLFSKHLPLPLPSFRFFSMVRWLKQWKPDVLITNTRFFLLNALMVWIAKHLLRIHIIHVEHGSSHVQFTSRLLQWCGNRYDMLIGGYILRNANTRVAISGAVKAFVEEVFSVHCDAVLYNAVHPVTDGPVQSEARAHFDLPTDARIIGFAGRLTHEKGIPLLLEAYRKVQNEFSEVHLVIAGEGPLQKEVQHAARNNKHLHYIGLLDRSGMRTLFSAIDIFVHPSLREGMPTVVLEAAMHGKWIITTPAGDTQAIIPSEKHGTIISANDSTAISTALIESLRNYDEKAGAIAAAVQEHTTHTFSWDARIQEWITLLQNEVPQ